MVGLITWELHVLDLVGLYDGIAGFNGIYTYIDMPDGLLYRFILPVCNAGMTEGPSTAHRGCRDWLSKPQ